MGLDMYLEKRHYVKQWDHQLPEERFAIQVLHGNRPYNVIKPERTKYIIEQVGYWRKANAIHHWFVENVQSGIDDCGYHYVQQEKLQELLDTVNAALASDDPSTILPTQAGFFFGSTDYDEWYFEDLKSTKEMLESVLGEPNSDSLDGYFYHASW